MYCFRVFGLFVCVGMLVLRAIVYAVAVICCKAPFHVARVCGLHALCLFRFFFC